MSAKRISDSQIDAFSRLAIAGILREFPYKPGHVLEGPDSAVLPRQVHPVFYGSFDWHSSVHGHWMLLRLLKLFPEHAVAGRVREVLRQQLTTEGLAGEAHYLENNPAFERMYGWAWIFRMAEELHGWEDSDAVSWGQGLQPLLDLLSQHVRDYLPRLLWPIRCGFHPETAFPLAQILDYARAVGASGLEGCVVEHAQKYYRADRDYPVRYEPSGSDFFSAGLNEADLMRRILDPDDFSSWLESFLPDLASGECASLLDPAEVSDPTDGQIVHLAGLNLSRAWTMEGIGSALAEGDRRRSVLEESASRHSAAGLSHVANGHYEGDHWLASFAVYLLTQVGRKR